MRETVGRSSEEPSWVEDLQQHRQVTLNQSNSSKVTCRKFNNNRRKNLGNNKQQMLLDEEIDVSKVALNDLESDRRLRTLID